MKKIVLWFATTFTIVVLLFGYRTSTNATTASAASSVVSPSAGSATTPATTSAAGTTGTSAAAGTSAGTGTGNAVTAPSSATTSSSGSTSPSTTAEPAASTTTTYTGDAASTRWGDVQVSITVTDGTITAVDVPVYPTGNGKDQQINARALPVLVKETLSSQSAKIDMVSGATVTSDGYLESLQSALDQAGL